MDTLFFYTSKTFWTLVQPDALLFYALALALFLLHKQQWRWAKRVLQALFALLLIIAVLPLAAWMAEPLESRLPTNPTLPAKVDGIIVLGGFLSADLTDYWQQAEVSEGVERGLAFAELARRYPQARLVMSGGTGSMTSDLREADYVAQLLETLQVDTARIIVERNSRNTAENAAYSKALVQPKAGETWVLITSATHMPRAVGVFCNVQWPVIAWPVDHGWVPGASGFGFNLVNNWASLDYVLHEWLGLLAYHLTGKTDALLPMGCAHPSE